MSATVTDFTAARAWGDAVSGTKRDLDAECADIVRGGMAGMTELMSELLRAARSGGLPPGARIEFEVAVRGRRAPLD